VLKAIGLDDDLARASLRFGLGRFTTDEEVDYVVDRLAAVVARLTRH
jgi:cysteine desulfurase